MQKLLFFLFGLIALCLASSNDELKTYSGYTVYKVTPRSDEHIGVLKSLSEKLIGEQVSFWTDVRGLDRPVDIMVSPNTKDTFLSLLKKMNFQTEIKIEDVGKMIGELAKTLNTKLDDDFDYSKYHTYEQINAWIDSIALQYNDRVSVINFGKSYEKRDIRGFKISLGAGRKAVWIDGGIHAREWISPATVIYIAEKFLSQYGQDADITKILDTYDVYVLPVFNVDGYAYTWKSDRLWRKTRKPNKGSVCVGTDPNRNWDAHFCETGASRNPCSDTFCGSEPFSEVETKLISDYILSIKDRLASYMNVHSYSQLWMSPWGWTNQNPPDFAKQNGASKAAIEALASLYGTKYEYGTIANTIYLASGSSVDWCYDKAGIVFSHTPELRDTGRYGFLLPENQITPTGEETLLGYKKYLLYIIDNA
jgi:murein tripeptide amidase MpaA